MFKRSALFFLLSLTFLQAEIDRPFSLRVGAAGFFPECGHFREIYGVTPLYQFQLNYAFVENLSCFGNASFLWAGGRTCCCGDRTYLQLIPVSLGLLFTSNCSSTVQAYLGGGGAYTFVCIQDDCPYVRSEMTNHRFGTVLKSGLICWKGIFSVQLFVDFLFQSFRFKTSDPSLECHHANMNALIVGGAVGVRM